MSVQVGGYCYATQADAAPPACAAFVPLSTVTGSQLVTVGCTAATPDGQLTMYRSVVDMSTAAAPVVTSFTQHIEAPPCVQADYVNAGLSLLGPLLAVWVTCWGMWRIIRYLQTGRSDQT